MSTEIVFALDGLKEPKLDLAEGLIPYSDGSVRVRFNPIESDNDLLGGVLAISAVIGFTYAAMKDDVLTLDFSKMMVAYLFAAVVMIAAGWQAFKYQEKTLSPLILNAQGIEHFACGFLKWSEIKDFYIREVSFMNLHQDRRVIHWVLHEDAFQRIYKVKNRRFIRSDSLMFYSKDHAFDIERDHMGASLDSINECARYFFFCHRKGIQPILPWIQVPELKSKTTHPQEILHSLRTDSLTRRLKTLRSKRAHAVKK